MPTEAHVCFVSLSTYPLFDPSVDSNFGGSEVRGWLFGTGLAKLPGYRVSFIVLDHGQGAMRRFGRVDVHAHSLYRAAALQPVRAPAAGLWSRIGRRVRALLAPKPFTVGDYAIGPEKLETYQRVDADVYCTFGVGNATADIAAFCRAHGKKFVLFAGSSDDFSASYRADSIEYNAYGSRGDVCHYAIRNADAVITQTDDQKRLLRERFSLEGTTIRNPFDLSGVSEPLAFGQGPRTALWIGKSDLVKQPLVLLQLARLCPSVPFRMVMNRANARVFEQVQAEKPANVEIIERVPFGESDALFRQAYVLVNTSVFEGFPNAFLQAGKYGVPILSLQVDPDGFIAASGCGASAGGDLAALAGQLESLCREPARRDQCGQRAYRYVQEHHRIEDKIAGLDAILRELVPG